MSSGAVVAVVAQNDIQVLNGAFRLGRELAADALFDVLSRHQLAESPHSPRELHRRALSAVDGALAVLTRDEFAPGFSEELGEVLCAITDGSDRALLDILDCVETVMREQVPAHLDAELRMPIRQLCLAMTRGWILRQQRTPDPLPDNTEAIERQLAMGNDEQFLAAVIDQSPMALVVIDLERGLPSVFSPAYGRLFGFTPEEEMKLGKEEMQNEDSADDDFDLLADMIAGRIPYLERVSARPHRDGRSIPFHLVAWPVRGEDGEVTHLANLFTSTSHSVVAAAGSGLAEKRVRYLLQISPDPVAIVAEDGTIRYASPSVESSLGYDPDALIGTPIDDLVAQPSRQIGEALLASVTGAPRTRSAAELELRLADGATRWFEVLASNLLDVPDVQGIVLQGRDVTDRRALQDHLEHMARTESLTGLLNRRGFIEGLHQWLELRREAGTSGNQLLICYIDLDNFKYINDRHGHGAGDATLTEVGRRLGTLVAGKGLAGRLGGDEFVLMVEVADEDARQEFVDALADCLSGSIEFDGRAIPFDGSVGMINLLLNDQSTFDAVRVLQQADEGLIRVKSRR